MCSSWGVKVVPTTIYACVTQLGRSWCELYTWFRTHFYFYVYIRGNNLIFISVLRFYIQKEEKKPVCKVELIIKDCSTIKWLKSNPAILFSLDFKMFYVYRLTKVHSLAKSFSRVLCFVLQTLTLGIGCSESLAISYHYITQQELWCMMQRMIYDLSLCQLINQASFVPMTWFTPKLVSLTIILPHPPQRVLCDMDHSTVTIQKRGELLQARVMDCIR